MSQPYLFQNIFFDVLSTVPSGQTSIAGQKMIPLEFPRIDTLIYKTQSVPGEIPRIQGTVPGVQGRPVEKQNDIGGIMLNLNLVGVTPQIEAEINPSELQPKTMGRKLPTTPHEVLNVLHLITGQKAGKRNESFTIAENREIAKSLQLSTQGSKEILANRIRAFIIGYFNLPQQ